MHRSKIQLTRKAQAALRRVMPCPQPLRQAETSPCRRVGGIGRQCAVPPRFPRPLRSKASAFLPISVALSHITAQAAASGLRCRGHLLRAPPLQGPQQRGLRQILRQVLVKPDLAVLVRRLHPDLECKCGELLFGKADDTGPPMLVRALQKDVTCFTSIYEFVYGNHSNGCVKNVECVVW